MRIGLFCLAAVLAACCGAQQYLVSPNAAIADNGPGIRSDIAVSGGPTSIVSYRVHINVTHPRINDVGVYLIPPSLAISPPYTEATLVGSGAFRLALNSGPGANFTDTQFTATGDPGFNAVGALYAMPYGSAPFTGLRQGPGMQTMWGTNANGTWGLAVFDQAASQTGALDSWSIEFAAAGISIWAARLAITPFAVPIAADVRAQAVECVAPFGAQSVISLAFTLTGTAGGADYSVARLWRDLNFDGYADKFSEPQLDTDRTFSGNTVAFPNVSLNVNQGRAQILLLLTPSASAATKTLSTQLSSGGVSVNPGAIVGSTFPISGPSQNLLGALALPYSENFDGSLAANLFARWQTGPGLQASAVGGNVTQYIIPSSGAPSSVTLTTAAISGQAPQSSPRHALLEYQIPGAGYEGISALDFHFDLSAYSPVNSAVAFTFAWASLSEDPTAADGVFLSDDGGATWFGCAFKFPFVAGTTLAYRSTTLDLSTLALTYGKASFNNQWTVRIQINGTASVPNDGLLLDNVSCIAGGSGVRLREAGAAGPIILWDSAPSAARDFGTQIVTSGPTAPLTIHVHNPSTSAVTLGTPASTQPHFVINTAGFAVSLAGGASTTFTVAFDPTNAGNFTADITITHNSGAVTSPFAFKVMGTGVFTPPLEVREQTTSGTVIAFGAAAANGRDFGYQDLGAGPTSPLTIHVINTGASTWTLGMPTLTGVDAAHFQLNTSGFVTSLPSATYTSFALVFDPATTGQKNASVSFSHNSTGSGGPPNPFVFGVTGYGALPAQVEVRDANLGGPIINNGDPASSGRAFGNQNISAGASGQHTIAIRNAGNSVLSLGKPVLTGPNASEFLLDLSTFTVALAPSATTGFKVDFDPVTLGAKSAFISFTHNGINTSSPFTCGLSGTGTAAPIMVVREGSATGPLLVSGSIATGARIFGAWDVSAGPTAPVTIHIANLGNADLALGTVAMQLGASSDFVVNASGMLATVPPSGFTTFTIAFDPQTTGAKSEGANVFHNATSTNPFVVGVSGTAVSGPLLDVHVGSVAGPRYDPYAGTQSWQDFGKQDIATGPTATVTLFLLNIGSSILTVGTPSLTGAHPGEFALGLGGFQTTLAPASSTSLTIAFDPTLTGLKACFVQFTHNSLAAYTTPLSITFMGTGSSLSAVPQIELRVGSAIGMGITYGQVPGGALLFGYQDISAGSTAAVTIFVSNTGSATMTMALPTMSGSPSHFVLDPSGFTTSLAAGSNTSFTIAFDPSTTMAHGESVQVIHNGSNMPNPFVFGVSGTGVALPVLEVRVGSITGTVLSSGAPASGPLAFGVQDIAAGATAAVTVFVRNIGTVNLTWGSPVLVTGVGQFVLSNVTPGTSIGPGSSASYDVAFDPSATGAQSGSVGFSHDALPYGQSGFTQFSFFVSGQGVSGPVVDVREVSDSGPVIVNGSPPSAARDFGSRDVNAGPSATLSIVVINRGAAVMSLGVPQMASISGTNPADFVVDTTGFNMTLNPAAQTSFIVSFDPIAAGAKSASVEFTHTATTSTSSPFRFEVTGIGTGTPGTPTIEVREFAVSGPLVTNGAAPSGGRAFANQLVMGGPTSALLVFVRNQGAGNLNLGMPQLSGADAAEFGLQSSGFVTSVTPGNSTSFSIVFDPSTTGAKTATVSFTHDAPLTTSSPFEFQISGIGIDSTSGGGSGPGTASGDEGCSTNDFPAGKMQHLGSSVLLLFIAFRVIRRRMRHSSALGSRRKPPRKSSSPSQLMPHGAPPPLETKEQKPSPRTLAV